MEMGYNLKNLDRLLPKTKQQNPGEWATLYTAISICKCRMKDSSVHHKLDRKMMWVILRMKLLKAAMPYPSVKKRRHEEKIALPTISERLARRTCIIHSDK